MAKWLVLFQHEVARLRWMPHWLRGIERLTTGIDCRFVAYGKKILQPMPLSLERTQPFRVYRHIERRGTAANRQKDTEKVPARRANRRSFDCASRDETARAFAQDDNFYINQSP